MIKKSLIDTRKMVPEHFGNNREFQVFLRLFNIALSNIKSDTDNFISNLLDPLRCKARLLPLLSNYVGWEYNPRERVITNRWITKLFPYLNRNRGSERGIILAMSLAICLMNSDFDNFTLDKQFSIELDEEIDELGNCIDVINIYTYYMDYIPILHDLIEIVRPAGVKINFIPSHSISSSETISLTDEFSIAKYDYITGKLLSINDIDIYVKNSWDLLIDEHAIKSYKWHHLEDYLWDELKPKTWSLLENDTSVTHPYGAIPGLAPYNIENKNITPAEMWNFPNVKLVDGRFFDNYGNDLNRYVDQSTGKILYGDGTWNNELVKETRIFKQDPVTGVETYTGMYFDVSSPAKVMNTYYKLTDSGVFSGFYLSEDNKCIYSSDNMEIKYVLKNYVLNKNSNPVEVWKVYDYKTDKKYKWHVNLITRKFTQDNDGEELIKSFNEKEPFTETTVIGKKAYIMKVITDESGNKTLEATKYYVNKYGDIIDPAGNIILSKKDRYKVSDSSAIGFSEVHNAKDGLSTYDATNILSRDWSYIKDSHMKDKHGRDETNNFDDYTIDDDPRYKFTKDVFVLDNPTREYTGTNLIRFVSSSDLSHIKSNEEAMIVPFFVTNFDSENASGSLKIKVDLPLNYSLADVFTNLKIYYEDKYPNTELKPRYDVLVEWTPNKLNKYLFNLSELENPIRFVDCGTIEKRTLHWASKDVILGHKMYDGTTKVFTNDRINKYIMTYQDVVNDTHKIYEQNSTPSIKHPDSLDINWVERTHNDNVQIVKEGSSITSITFIGLDTLNYGIQKIATLIKNDDDKPKDYYPENIRGAFDLLNNQQHKLQTFIGVDTNNNRNIFEYSVDELEMTPLYYGKSLLPCKEAGSFANYNFYKYNSRIVDNLFDLEVNVIPEEGKSYWNTVGKSNNVSFKDETITFENINSENEYYELELLTTQKVDGIYKSVTDVGLMSTTISIDNTVAECICENEKLIIKPKSAGVTWLYIHPSDLESGDSKIEKIKNATNLNKVTNIYGEPAVNAIKIVVKESEVE